MRISDWSSDVCSSDLDNVKVAGVVVGKVTSVSTDDGQAVVSMQIDDDHADLPKDSSAAIRWRNLIGQRYVYLYPGDSAEALQDGSTIERTTSVVDLGELFNRLGPIRSEEHTSELQSLMRISYAVFCLKKNIRKSTIP